MQCESGRPGQRSQVPKAGRSIRPKSQGQWEATAGFEEGE